MEKMNDLRDLLKHEIEDLYSAEEQIIEALPLMIDKAENKILKNALTEHLKITKQQKQRLDKVQKLMGDGGDEGKKKGIIGKLFGGGKHHCKGMAGIIEEGNKIMNADISPEARDAAIIASSQKVEHYEICGYGTAKSYAEELGLDDVAKQLAQTLQEEYDADLLMTQLAEERVNKEAESPSENTGTGSSKGRSTGRVKEKSARKEEMEMAPANSNRSRSSGRSNSGSSSAKGSRNNGESRKPSGSSRSESGARGNAPAKKAASSGRSSGSNGRSSSGGRGGSSTRGRR